MELELLNLDISTRQALSTAYFSSGVWLPRALWLFQDTADIEGEVFQ